MTDKISSVARMMLPFTSIGAIPPARFAIVLNIMPVNSRPEIFSSVSLNPQNMGIIIKTRMAGVVIVPVVTWSLAKIPKIMPMTALIAAHTVVTAV